MEEKVCASSRLWPERPQRVSVSGPSLRNLTPQSLPSSKACNAAYNRHVAPKSAEMHGASWPSCPVRVRNTKHAPMLETSTCR